MLSVVMLSDIAISVIKLCVVKMIVWALNISLEKVKRLHLKCGTILGSTYVPRCLYIH